MIRRIIAIAAIATLGALATNPVRATDGKLDDNGCHYDRRNGDYHCHEARPPNPDKFANVKKSRENLCIDKRSSSYRTTIHFVAYQTMRQCVMSGGIEPMDGDDGGLSNKPWPNL